MTEKRLWSASLLFLVFLWTSAYFVRFGVDFLRNSGVLRPTVAVVFLASAAAVGSFFWRRRSSLSEWLLLFGGLGVYGLAFVWMERPEERVHLVEYSILAALIWFALHARWDPLGLKGWRKPDPWAVLLNALAGWSDEGVQAILPNRVYDLRDVGFNALAGLMAVVFLSLYRKIRSTSNG